MNPGMHKDKQDKWLVERNVELYPGVVGTRLTQYYSLAWEISLDTLDLREGDPMPFKPVAGEGSGATIVAILLGVNQGTTSREIQVIGFEAKGWS